MYINEFIGSIILIYIGQSVNSLVNLHKPNLKGKIFVLAAGRNISLIPAVLLSMSFSTKINPVITVYLAITKQINYNVMALDILFQFIGALFGSFLSYLTFRNNFNTKLKNNKDLILLSFVTKTKYNKKFIFFIVEFLAGLFLILCNYYVFKNIENNITLLLVSAIFNFSIWISIYEISGSIINPFRDLAPRIIYQIIYKKDAMLNNYIINSSFVLIGAIIASILIIW